MSDGQSPQLATAKDYGDFEFYVDWLMVSPNGDSGIYLRGYPQVQVWDPDESAAKWATAHPRARARSGTTTPTTPASGRWSRLTILSASGTRFTIKMVGSRVWIWLNDKQTVDGQVLDNYFDRTAPIVARGPIELQTHGSEIRFRNIFIREIPAAEAKATLDKVTGAR